MRVSLEAADGVSMRGWDPEPLDKATEQAARRLAPLWPLSSFVAVNPFLGFADTPFERAAGDLRRLTGARLLMPRAFYRDAMNEGRITPNDLAAAMSDARAAGLTRDSLLRAVVADPKPAPRVATVAEVLDNLSDGDRQVSRTAFMIDEISRWCAAYFDQGQASWPAPWRSMDIYAAWRWSAQFDGNAKAMGVKGLAETVASLSPEPRKAIAEVLHRLEIPQDQWSDYLFRALYDVRGWAAYVRRLDWEAELAGRPDARLTELLAIRLVWGYALFRQRTDEAFFSAWKAALNASRAGGGELAPAEDLSLDLVLQRAYEHAFQRRMMETLAAGPQDDGAQRPDLQAVFCIDVRSEVYRRALETVSPRAETFGFAGFFGMPLAYDCDGETAQAHCPVLLRPAFHVQAASATPEVGRQVLRRAGAIWGELKQSAISCFAFVEAFGLTYGGKLAAAAVGGGSGKGFLAGPNFLTDGLALDERVDLAEGALRGMSLTKSFARLVVLVGHSASTTNNPHAASLNCGACGGRSGAPNAQYAAALLNDVEVRNGLEGRGIAIPEDTWFAAALHDTTTDAIQLTDQAAAPATHARDLAEAAAKFEEASRLARAERAPLLGLSAARAGQIFARSGDWSQVRPEWGLARAAAFIAAPRSLTAGRNLEGRAFLHSYDRGRDPDLKVLELILTAPMVVASWISLQYYGSTVDNAAFGAGDKTLHNVCGRVGVLEGNGGDLRAGLPLQSIHDGERYVHEPLRLSVFIAASPDSISEVLARQPQVRALFDNDWIFLFALDDVGRTTHRYAGALAWEALS